MFAKVLLLTSFLFGQAHMPETAMIGNVSTNMPSGGGIWSSIPSNVTKMTIFVEAENTETVLFWLVPTGTQTWGDRELIGYDKNGSDGWSLTWEFGNRRLHDHIHVQALGSDHSSQANDIINVVTELK